MTIFKSDRLLVRRFTSLDADDFFALNGDARAMHFVRPAKNREDSDAFLQDNLNLYQDDSVVGRFAVYAKEHGAFVGTFSFLYLAGESDFHIGYALVPSEWGKGYASELVKFGTPYFFEKTSWSQLFAITDPGNIPSQNVLLKNGYRRHGKWEEGGKALELFVIDRG